MKKLLFTLLIGITTLAYSQAPQQISYQGVARNASGTVLANQPIGIRFDIHQVSASGAIVFSETHTGVLTNGFGLFTTYIGSISNLSVINWATNSYFIEVSIDPNTGTYSSLGSQQLMSVPYALNAGSAPAPAVSYTNNILSVGGNTTTIPASTTYTAGAGINVTGNTITNAAPDQIVTITPAGSASVTGTYPNFTVNTPTIQAYTAGNGIDITGGVISNTAAAVTPTITGTGATTVNGTYPNLTINTPTTQVYTAGNGIDITGGIISNTLTPVTSTITSTGIAVVTPSTGNTFNVDVPVPVLSYTAGTNVLSLSQGTTVTTATLNGTGSNTVSIVGSGLATVTPTTGSTFSVSVPSPTFTTNGPTSISGAYPNYTVNSVTSPTTSLVAGNLNLTLFPSGNTYTLDVKSYSLTANSNTLTLSNGASITTATVPASSTTTLTQGANVNVSGSPSNYTVSAPAYSITLPGGNVVQITNGVSTSTAPIAATNLTLNGANNNILSAGGNTVALNTYSAGTGISVTGTAPNLTISNTSPAVTPTITGTGVATVNNVSPNYTVNVPMSTYNNNTGVFTTGTQTITVVPTLTLVGNVLRSGPATNTVNIPVALLSYTGSATQGILQSGASTNTVSIPNYTISNTSNTITLNNGVSNSTAIIPVPTLTLVGSTLQSGPATNTVSLSGIGGIYAGSGSLQAGTTTVSIGTNTLNFVASNNLKPIANFVGNGTIQPSLLAIANATTGASGMRFIGSFTTAPVNYGQLIGSASGLTMGAGSFLSALSTSTNGNVLVNTTSDVQGRLQIAQTSSTVNPHVNVISPTGLNYGRLKYSNTSNTTYFSNEAISQDGDLPNSSWSVSHFNGSGKEFPVLLINGQRMTYINALNAPLATFHVMTSTATASGGMASEGFAQSGQINLIRNNNAGAGARTSVFGGQEIGKINFSAYDGTGYGDGAKIYAVASENVTNTAKGTDLFFGVVPNTTTSSQELLKLGNDGVVTLNPYNTFNKAALDVKGRLRVDSSLTMAAYNIPPITSFVNEGRIYYDRPTNKFKVSENGGAYVDLIPGSGSAPWQQGASIVTLSNINDKVGIGTNTPNASLDIKNNAASLDGIALDINNVSNGSNGLQLRHFGVGNAAYVEVNNSGSTASAIQAQHNGVGTVIYATNTNSTNTSAVIQANSNSSGVAIYGTNSNGATSQFDNFSSFAAIDAINYNTGNAINATASSGRAINASSSGSTTPTANFANSNSGDVIMSFAGTGRAIYAQTGANGMATSELTNTGTGPVIFAYKNSGTTGGVVANYANNSNTNPADVVLSYNNGVGAAVHAANNPSNLSSALSLWVENGHIKATGTNATSSTTVTSISTSTVIGNDVVGKISITTVATAIPANQEMIKVQFAKSYPAGVTPNVIITPSNANAAGAQGYVSTVSNTGFSIFFNVGTAAIIRTYTFNYMVIE